MTVDPYKILQVDSEAEDEVITAAYRRLARKYHPDVVADDASANRMAAINAAFELIGDPARRAAFDRERALREAVARRATAPRDEAETGRAAKEQGGTGRSGAETRTPDPRSPDTVSADWTSGRSSFGGGYDASMHQADGTGAAGPAPGQASGSVLNFGRYAGWSIGEIARTDLEYIEWLDRMPIGRPYREELDGALRRAGRRRSADVESHDRRGLFRRR